MRTKFNNNPATGQLRWVILLLVIVVILPTVCLLWFMTEAVKNERLAVRQKLIDVYTKKARLHISLPLKGGWQSAISILTLRQDDIKKACWSFYDQMSVPAMIVYDQQGQLVWPIIQDDMPVSIESELYTKAQQLEYADQNYSGALGLYTELIDSNSIDEYDKIKMDLARCYLKTGEVNNVKSLYHDIAYPILSRSNDFEKAFLCSPEVMRARVALANLYAKTNDPDLQKHLEMSLPGLVYLEEIKEYRTLLFTPDVWIWGLTSLISIAENTNYDLRYFIGRAQQRLTEQTCCLLVSGIYDYEKVKQLQAGIVTSLETEPGLYGRKTEIQGRQILLIADTDCIVNRYLRGQWDEISDESCLVRLIDDKGRCLAGPNRPDYESLITVAIGELFPKWKAEIYLRNYDVFENAASRQAAIYTWTGLLVVLLILASGAIATQTISRQIKLNRLKNDFIATVTHELKTPLSSMRVLVDTLLEGSYNDRQQAKEYLELISKENLRLSRLIDNFLTFSRMERNKQAFDIVKTSPTEIANAAADAVQTKFNKENCNFTVTVDDGLPSVSADKDAMVTVLVNLLDNAYKYSYDDKKIELKVSFNDGLVCFTVTDNGIGMTARQIKKAFDRFYQADSSLSRQAEGTGLGLSIVKFIVDAHKGRINIESKQNKGSTFTIKLAAVD